MLFKENQLIRYQLQAQDWTTLLPTLVESEKNFRQAFKYPKQEM